MKIEQCPRCGGQQYVKSGIVNNRQRYRCRSCGYHFTVGKQGKKIDDYYVVKALQLYVEGVSYREIERLLGISHVTVMNWVRQHKIKRPVNQDYHPTYRILTHRELTDHLLKKENLSGAGLIITELGDKYMMIKWERFRS
ncbi:MAG: hypothetical protein LPK80_02795 [Bacteroidota bacterium]|nr:hypothetical protein [Bacteroidota bacterium]